MSSSSSPPKQGSAHGRFQPFHLGHLDYMRRAFAKCDFLWIGLTNTTRDFGATPLYTEDHRELALSNPLTFFERLQMLRLALIQSEFTAERFAIVPCPIETPKILQRFFPIDAEAFTNIREPWNERKIEILRDAGYKVSILDIDEEQLAISSTRIRDMILVGDEAWRELVPASVSHYLDTLDFGDRLRRINTGVER